MAFDKGMIFFQSMNGRENILGKPVYPGPLLFVWTNFDPNMDE